MIKKYVSLTIAFCSFLIEDTRAALPPAGVEYVKSSREGDTSAAVIVQSMPLIHTRQIFPVGPNGQVTGSTVHEQMQAIHLNLHTILNEAGADLNGIVRLNVYAVSDKVAGEVRELLAQVLSGRDKPAMTYVVTQLPVEGALFAIDALVAARDGQQNMRKLFRLNSSTKHSDASLLPTTGTIYVSGQAEKGDTETAARKTLASLVAALKHPGSTKSDVVQFKVFMNPVSEAEIVKQELEKLYGKDNVPPVVFVEWRAAAPSLEIELVAAAPESEKEQKAIHHLTLPGKKASPVFCHATVVYSPVRIYISGLFGNNGSSSADQVGDIFNQLKKINGLAGTGLRHYAKATYYVTDRASSSTLNKIRTRLYDPLRPPAASKATVRGVGRPGKAITIDMIAVPAQD